MGESSFLASWFNRRAVMMGMFMCVCVFIDSVTVWQWASSVGMWNVYPPASLTPLCREDPL